MSYSLKYFDSGFVEENTKVVLNESQYQIVCTMASHFDKAFFVLNTMASNTDCGFVDGAIHCDIRGNLHIRLSGVHCTPVTDSPDYVCTVDG